MSPTPSSADRNSETSPGSSGDRSFSRIPLRLRNLNNERPRRLPFAINYPAPVKAPLVSHSSIRSPLSPSPNTSSGASELSESSENVTRTPDDLKSRISTPEESDDVTWLFKPDRKRVLSRISSTKFRTCNTSPNSRILGSPSTSRSPTTTRRRLSSPSGRSEAPVALGTPQRSSHLNSAPSTPDCPENCVFSETIGKKLAVREVKVPEDHRVGQQLEEESKEKTQDGSAFLMTKTEKRSRSGTEKSLAPPPIKPMNRRRSSLPLRDLSAREITSDGSTVPISNPKYDKSLKTSFLEQVFILLAIVGKGSFGEVFLARNKENGQDYAIKAMTRKVSQICTSKYREVMMLMAIPKHRNILEFHSAWEENEKLFIQTEICWMTLLEYSVQMVRIPENRLWKILKDLANGLYHLHSNEIVHADIKPDNIFLMEDLTVKLGDFGIAVDLKNPKSQAEEGDCRYLALEVLKDGSSKKADVFALGVSLLEVSTNLDVPANGEPWEAIRDVNLPCRLFTGITDKFRTLVESMLAKDPIRRPSAKDLLDQVQV